MNFGISENLKVVVIVKISARGSAKCGDEVVESMTRDEMVRDIAEVFHDESDFKLSETDSREVQLYTVRAQLQSLPVARETIERHGVMDDACKMASHDCHQELMLEWQISMAQTTIEDHFVKK